VSWFTRRTKSGDRGAVAVIVAICCVVLFGMGAIVIDLGNGWSRRRMAQTDADMAALAGAAYLPDQAQALSKAYQYLVDNLPKSDNGADAGPIANYSDGNEANGEIEFPTADRITVFVPERRVDFGLAGVLGYSNTNVTAQATAEVDSPKKLLPFFLNASCNYGQQVIKDSSNSPPQLFAPTQPAGVRPDPSGAMTTVPDPVIQQQAGVLTLSGARLGTTATTTVTYTNQGNHQVVSPTAVAAGGSSLTAPIPPLYAGTWYVQVWTPSGGYSTDQYKGAKAAPSFTVVAPLGGPCGLSDTGDFGLLDSPRKPPPDNSGSWWFDFNLSLGLDHGVQCFPGMAMPLSSNCPSVPVGGSPLPPPVDKNCMPTGNTPVPGGKLDDDPTVNDANCMYINTGNKVDATTDGLISGGSDGGVDFVGKLTQGSSTGCPGPGGSNPTTITLGKTYTINNDTLSCYMASGHTLADLTANNNNPETGIVKPEIFQSPRFFFVPVLNYVPAGKTQPQAGWYPIIDFRAVFITDETPTSPATTANGIQVNNSSQKISSVTVFAFNIKALPESLANNGGTIPYLGFGPKIPVLID
jgi:Flp pilus assembly protein TadG